MPSFYRRQFKNVERTYHELALYASSLSMTGPTVIVPALPLPTPDMIHMPDAGYDGAVSELHELRDMLEHWFERVYSEPTLRAQKETRRFIESEYSYEPLPVEPMAPSGHRKQAARAMAQVQALSHVFSGALFAHEASPSGLASMLGMRAPPKPTPAALVPVHLAVTSPIGVSDPDEELALARGELTRLEKQLDDVVHASARVADARKAVHAAMRDVAGALLPLATLEEARAESVRGRLPRALRSANTMYTNVTKLSNTIMHAEAVTLRDAMAYQELNLRTARMVLQERTAVVVELDIAKRVTANKRHEAEQLRIARQLRPDRVDAAVAEVREAHHHEQLLERYLAQISQSLRESLHRHSVYTHQDLQHVMLEHARISGVYEQRVSEMLGLFDMDLSAAAQDAQQAAMAKASVKRKMTPAQAAAARAVRGEEPSPETVNDKSEPAPEPSRTAESPTTPALADDIPAGTTEDQPEAVEPLPEPEPSPWAQETVPPVVAPDDPSAEAWASNAWDTDAPAVQTPSTAASWSLPEATSAPGTPAPVPEEGQQPESNEGEQSYAPLFQSRLSSRRRVGGLSASDAAKFLAGTF